MIDIILATYNGEKYVEQQLKSIQNNVDYDKLISRVIVVDDGSQDGTTDIVKVLAASDNKIVLEKNISGAHGACENFAFGISLSDANYIMLCDQDDIWLKDKISLSFSRMIEAEKRNPDKPILVFSDKQIVDENLNLICDSYFQLKKIDKGWHHSFDRLLHQNVISGCTMLFNRKLSQIAQPIPSDCYMHDWWISLFASKFGQIEFIDKPLIQYRQHANNTIGARQKGLTLVTNFFYHLDSFEGSFRKTAQQAKLFKERVEMPGHKKQDQATDTLIALATVEQQSIVERLKYFNSNTITRSNAFGRFALFLTLIRLPVLDR
ncbi:glycosyltransferase family 2 protein [Vibrio sp. JC009]|uniref:glycosyltransferase family 2 protein n=1 Tax=Vibrio sp. JC009 TaxID=2912314 RepID=UPI0023B179DC|nr:glycosyltransferase family 2 protein [Vibrio sp. JC009]WED24150.1 glycosyltransferase family 2 protein [Vibrio sp. JC009]